MKNILFTFTRIASLAVIVGLFAGCAATRPIGDTVLGAGGAYLGHELSDGNPIATAAGAGADEHDDREQGALEEHLHRGGIGFADELDGRADFVKADVRMLLRETLDRRARAVGNIDGARTPGADHFEADHGLAVEQCKLALLGGLVANFRDRVEADSPAVTERNRKCREFLRG